MGVEERGSFGVGFCRGHDCVIDVGVSSRKLKHRRWEAPCPIAPPTKYKQQPIHRV